MSTKRGAHQRRQLQALSRPNLQGARAGGRAGGGGGGGATIAKRSLGKAHELVLAHDGRISEKWKNSTKLLHRLSCHKKILSKDAYFGNSAQIFCRETRLGILGHCGKIFRHILLEGSRAAL